MRPQGQHVALDVAVATLTVHYLSVAGVLV